MEYRNITRNAKMQEQGHGNAPHASYCVCCGKKTTLRKFYFTTAISSQVNGVYAHCDCLENMTATKEQCGNKSSQSLSHVDTFTVAKNDYDILTYLSINGYHTITKKHGAIGYDVESVKIVNENAMNKIYSGLIAYGNNRPITVKFENGYSMRVRISDVNEAIGLYNRIHKMKNTNGKPYRTAYEELSKLLIK